MCTQLKLYEIHYYCTGYACRVVNYLCMVNADCSYSFTRWINTGSVLRLFKLAPPTTLHWTNLKNCVLFGYLVLHQRYTHQYNLQRPYWGCVEFVHSPDFISVPRTANHWSTGKMQSSEMYWFPFNSIAYSIRIHTLYCLRVNIEKTTYL